MTNKSLSQQLCEVCGIEPKGKLVFEKRNWDKKTWLSAGTGYKKFDFESTPNVRVDIIPTKFYDEKNGFQYPYSRIDEIIKLYDKNGYDFIEFEAKFIDFENNNNNFVKLGELKIKTTKKYHTLFEMLSLECNFTNKKDFLDFLVDHINDKKYYSGSYIFTFRDIIKKTIKNEQWEV